MPTTILSHSASGMILPYVYSWSHTENSHTEIVSDHSGLYKHLGESMSDHMKLDKGCPATVYMQVYTPTAVPGIYQPVYVY